MDDSETFFRANCAMLELLREKPGSVGRLGRRGRRICGFGLRVFSVKVATEVDLTRAGFAVYSQELSADMGRVEPGSVLGKEIRNRY